MPWRIIGMLLISLLFSLIVEYIGIAFLWQKQGAEHNRTVMVTESDYFAGGFTRSLLLSAPVTSLNSWISAGYQWLFMDSGFMAWLQSAQNVQTDNFAADNLNASGVWLLQTLSEFSVCPLVFLMQVTILVLSVPSMT